jgi:hypothetical protein
MAKKSPLTAVAGRARPKAARVERERVEFNALIATNPNYFGNLQESAFKPIKKIVGNTTYEELTCIGFNPKLDQLEATIQIKLAAGYGGNLCAAGSTEYVRFFLDYGAGWEDAGMVAVNVHDIPNITDCANKPDKPLVYVLTQPIEPKRDRCGQPVLPRVRGILSWNNPPPAGPANANWPPVWGNVLDRHIQIKPRPSLVVDLGSLFGIDPKAKLPLELEVIKFDPIPFPDPPPFALKELVELYGRGPATRVRDSQLTQVEPHRFALADVQPVLAGGELDQQLLSSKISQFKELNLDWAAIIGALEKTKGNVTYEELTCLGLDYNREWLVSTFVVKKPAGYSGNLCSKGSTEYISFWADWDNTCKWSYVGTAAVPVHDIASIPPDGLHYAAIMPVDLSGHRQPCEKPKIGRVRAVLSWNVPPSTVDPDAIPHWGNRVDTHVQIKPGDLVGVIQPKISILGGIGVANIFTNTTGLTKPGAKFALWDTFADPWDSARSCPFGGLITVQAPPVLFHKYKLWVQNVTAGGSEIQLTSPVWVTDQDGNSSNHFPGFGGMFDYLPVTQNLGSMLYNRWAPGGDDLWQMRLELFTGGGIFIGSTAWHRLRMDNTAPSTVAIPPTLDIHIDSGGDCKDFDVDTVINGHFVARDIYFGRYSLSVLPSSMNPNSPSPSSGNSQTAPAPGGDPWTLDTKGMKPCGYVVLLQVWDRAIRNSVPGQHNYNKDDVGFCLRAGE